MRVAIVGILHESNSFSAIPASLPLWESAGILEGAQIPDRYASANHLVSGFLELPDHEPEIDLVPLFFTELVPVAPITSEAFDALTSRALELLSQQGPWDIVLIANHGAAVSERYPDADGEFYRLVREAVGHETVIAGCFDMHANVSQLQISQADILTVYQTNPHVDARARALEAARLAVRTARGEIRPVMALATPPVAINILRQGTEDSPMRELLAEVETLRSLPDVLSLSVVEGYPYADVPHMGMSFVAITNDNEHLATSLAHEMALIAWRLRESFTGQAVGVEEALRAADAEVLGPVLILDTGDNVGAGSPADSTHVLEAAQRLGIGSLFCSIYDPDAVLECIAAGVGSTVELAVGGKTDSLHGQPVTVRGRVKLHFDGKWEDNGPTHGGAKYFDSGPSVLLETEDEHFILLISIRLGNSSMRQLTSVGVLPENIKIIVAKGTNSPRAAFESRVSRLIFTGSPGVSSADLTTFDFHHRRRPMFPFETEATYE